MAHETVVELDEFVEIGPEYILPGEHFHIVTVLEDVQVVGLVYGVTVHTLAVVSGDHLKTQKYDPVTGYAL